LPHTHVPFRRPGRFGETGAAFGEEGIPLELNLELLQQLPAEDEEAEDGLCVITCYYSCLSTGPGTIVCNVTSTFT
jgi:hypothetical protein